MSYDVHFGPWISEPSRNYTSNVAPMWEAALGVGLGELIIDKGQRAGDMLATLEAGVAAMKADPDRFRAMEPANGWGDFEGALAYLEWMAANCREWPEQPVEVSA